MDFFLVVASLAFLALAVLWTKQLLAARSSLPLPPSPKSLPILGNLLDLAGDDVNVKCRDWSRQFGIVLSLEAALLAHAPCTFLNCRRGYHLPQHYGQHHDRPEFSQSRVRYF
jgi:hypothetical protein